MIFSDQALYECAMREVRIRRRVYPGRIRNHRMRPSEAEYQIEAMTQIAEHFRLRAELPLTTERSNDDQKGNRA